MARTFTSGTFILLFVLLQQMTVRGQVTAIYSDYGGYWTSSSSSINSVKPDNHHNLLAFTWNGTTYSTGVSDGTLTSHSVGFTACKFRAFPISTVPTSGGVYYFVMLGQKADGVDNGADNSSATPFPANPSGSVLASYLTDGSKGLDLGTGLANIPAGSVLRFDLSANGLTLSAINDGIPDIFVTEEASPSSSSPDYFKFVDASGNTVGNVVSVTTNTLPQVGNWQADFYNLNSTQTDGTYINQPRPLAFYAADLSAFGITASNYMNAVALVYQPNGSSDPAFLAFNEPAISVSTQLNLTSQPSGYSSSVTLSPSPAVQVLDGLGQAIKQTGIPVTVSVQTGSATLSGTLTVNTDANGVATFSNLQLAGSGTVRLVFNSTSLNAATTGDITMIPLPLDWLSFTAQRQNDGVLLTWETARETGVRDFLVQRSGDAVAWETLDSLKAGLSSESIHSYRCLDVHALPGKAFYRILERDLDSRISISRIVEVTPNAGQKISIYPNPVKNGYCCIKLDSAASVRLFFADGKLARKAELPSGLQTLDLHGLPKGLYTLQIGLVSSQLLVE